MYTVQICYNNYDINPVDRLEALPSMRSTIVNVCDHQCSMALRVAHQKLRELLQVLNKETGDGLLALSGIGVATRDKLLAQRSKAADKGRSLRLYDVMEVEGIGASKLAAMTDESATADIIKYATCYTNLFGNEVSAVLNIKFVVIAEVHAPQYPSNILSVDLGRVNSAYALIDDKLAVHQWKKVDLGMPKPYSPMTCCENVSMVIIITRYLCFIQKEQL